MKNEHPPSKQKDEPGALPAPKPRAKFTDEFKRTAVAKLRESGTNATLLALELGIRRNQLYKWAKQLDALEPGKALKVLGRPPASDEKGAAGSIPANRQIAKGGMGSDLGSKVPGVKDDLASKVRALK